MWLAHVNMNNGISFKIFSQYSLIVVLYSNFTIGLNIRQACFFLTEIFLHAATNYDKTFISSKYVVSRPQQCTTKYVEKCQSINQTCQIWCCNRVLNAVDQKTNVLIFVWLFSERKSMVEQHLQDEDYKILGVKTEL